MYLNVILQAIYVAIHLQQADKIPNWAAFREKVPNFPSRCHLLVLHFFFLDFFFFGKVGVIPKEGRAWPSAPVLLLV